MAKKLISKTIRVDDLGGRGNAEPVRFSLEGVMYEVDLNKVHLKSFRKALGRYAAAGRQINVKTTPGESARGDADLQAIRQWAQSVGLKVGVRGRISGAVREAYNLSQGSTK